MSSVWSKTKKGCFRIFIWGFGVFMALGVIGSIFDTSENIEQTETSPPSKESSIQEAPKNANQGEILLTSKENTVSEKTEDTNPEEPSSEKIETIIVPYEIISQEDFSYPSVIRKQLRVVIPQDDYNQEDIEQTLIHISEEYTARNKVNALSIFMYDVKGIDGSWWIAQSDYAPQGDWSKADSVNTGQYSKFKYNITLKDFTGRTAPTEKQYKICTAYEIEKDKGNVESETAKKIVLKKFGYTEEQINEACFALLKYYM